MTALNLSQFTGMVPRRAKALLPEVNAARAENVRLLSGTIRALRETTIIASGLAGQTPHRLHYNDGTTSVEKVPNANIDIIQSPLLDDTQDRFYKFGDGIPKYNTAARIKAGSPWLDLGVPRPSYPLQVTATPNANASLIESRVYTYTLVSQYGEESPPAEPVSISGEISGTWNITLTGTGIPYNTLATRNVTKVNLYRSVTGFNSATLFRFATLTMPVSANPLDNVTYVDSATDYDVSQGYILETALWGEPPQDLEGAVVMPNGFLVGWVGRKIYMSEPYRPHAWNDSNQQAVEYDIVGLGVFGQSIVACTQGAPYIGQGVSPGSIALRKTNAVEPCLSRQSIVSTIYGVMYASPNGLVITNSMNPTIVTQQLLTKYEWQELYNPDNIVAAVYHNQYIAFYRPTEGFVLDPNEPMSAFIEISNTDVVVGLNTDMHTGDVLLHTSDILSTWDTVGAPPRTYIWTSKEFVSPKALNFGAARITFEDEQTTSDIIDPAQAAYNAQRILQPLNPFGSQTSAVGKVSNPIVIDAITPENRTPLGGSTLFKLTTSAPSASVIFRVYAIHDGVRTLKYETTTTKSEALMRLPATYKSSRYQFEVEGQRPIQSIKVASTARELRSV